MLNAAQYLTTTAALFMVASAAALAGDRTVNNPPDRSSRVQVFNSDTMKYQVGGGGGNPEWLIRDRCFVPEAGRRFIPSSAQVIEDANTHDAPNAATIKSAAPYEVCVHIRLHNDSLAFSSVWWGHLNVFEEVQAAAFPQ